MKISGERMEQLREFARAERTAILEQRGRVGEDPLATLAELPSIDEFVVRELRDQLLEDRGQLAEFTMARLASQSQQADAAAHRANADRVEFELLRQIADENPELTVAVWQAVGRLESAA